MREQLEERMGENSWKREEKGKVRREDMREHSEERMEWKSWNRGWKRMLGRNVGMEGLEERIKRTLGRNVGTEGFEENIVENVREKCWDGRVGRQDEREMLKDSGNEWLEERTRENS